MRIKKDLEKFLLAIPKLEAIEFIGVARILGVKVFKEDKTPKDFRELLEESIQRFEGSNRKRRKEILKLLKDVEAETLVARGRPESPSEEVGDGTEDSEN